MFPPSGAAAPRPATSKGKAERAGADALPAATLYAHKAILASKSGYFRAQFFDDGKTSLRITDLSPDVCLEVLQV